MSVAREFVRKTHARARAYTHTHTHTHTTHTHTYTYYEYNTWFSITLQAGIVLVSHSRAERLCIAIVLFGAISLKEEQLRSSLDKPHVYIYIYIYIY